MEYFFKEFTLEQLYELVEKNAIDLNPSYQRNFIWSPLNQRELIDTILKGYPLPSFFFYLKSNNSYEMVDGQQRTKTIYRFIKGEISSSGTFNKVKFEGVEKEKFLNYKIPVVVINHLGANDSLKEFYVLINKKGIHLNTPEMNKSEFYDTNFLKLANDLLSYQNFINLDLFTEAVSKRMNDRAFVEELLGYLLMGFKDKKKSVEEAFKSDITNEEYQMLDKAFKRVIDKVYELNKIKPISETRYKQKNDFYTLFSFIHENLDDNLEISQYQYRILLVLDGNDKDGRQFIRPSNDDCESLKQYANNCITQSNSKNARESRLNFFNSILKNADKKPNDILIDVLNYLTNVFGKDKIQLKSVSKYFLLDVEALQS